MEKLFQNLSLKNENDFGTKIILFEDIDIEVIRNVLHDLNMSDKNLFNNKESKFEHVNLILMFKYGKFLDGLENHLDEETSYKLVIL